MVLAVAVDTSHATIYTPALFKSIVVGDDNTAVHPFSTLTELKGIGLFAPTDTFNEYASNILLFSFPIIKGALRPF